MGCLSITVLGGWGFFIANLDPLPLCSKSFSPTSVRWCRNVSSALPVEKPLGYNAMSPDTVRSWQCCSPKAFVLWACSDSEAGNEGHFSHSFAASGSSELLWPLAQAWGLSVVLDTGIQGEGGTVISGLAWTARWKCSRRAINAVALLHRLRYGPAGGPSDQLKSLEFEV